MPRTSCSKPLLLAFTLFFTMGCQSSINAHNSDKPLSSLFNCTFIGPAPFRARLYCGDGLSLVIPKAFYVKLRQGHSFESHSSAIGQEIYPFIDWSPPSSRYQKLYLAKTVEDDLLTAILSDPMVKYVECDTFRPVPAGLEVAIEMEDWEKDIWKWWPGS